MEEAKAADAPAAAAAVPREHAQLIGQFRSQALSQPPDLPPGIALPEGLRQMRALVELAIGDVDGGFGLDIVDRAYEHRVRLHRLLSLVAWGQREVVVFGENLGGASGLKEDDAWPAQPQARYP